MRLLLVALMLVSGVLPSQGQGESGNHAAEGIRHNGGLGPLSEIEGLDGAKPAAASPSENLGAGQSYGDGLRSEGPGGGTGGRGGGAGPAGAGRGPGVLHGDDARRGVLPGALVTRGHPPSTRASPHRQQRACPVRQPRRGHWQRYKFKGRDDASGVVPWQKLNTTEETQAWRGQVIENQTSIINDKRGVLYCRRDVGRAGCWAAVPGFGTKTPRNSKGELEATGDHCGKLEGFICVKISHPHGGFFGCGCISGI